jgi:hypothetical protein
VVVMDVRPAIEQLRSLFVLKERRHIAFFMESMIPYGVLGMIEYWNGHSSRRFGRRAHVDGKVGRDPGMRLMSR